MYKGKITVSAPNGSITWFGGFNFIVPSNNFPAMTQIELK